MVRIFSVLLLISFLSISAIGCSQKKEEDLNQLVGYVGEKRDFNNSKQILVIPNIDRETIIKLGEEEIIKISKENEGFYFEIENDTYKQIQKGSKVVVHYDPRDGYETSNPPQRISTKVEVIEE